MSNVIRFVVAGIAGLSAASAGAVDLVAHQGFEICWATAVTKPAFLTAMRNSIEGGTTCLPPQSGTASGVNYTACNAPNGCGTGNPGCPVTIHSGVFTGDFVAGAFTAPGTVDNIPIPITVTGLPSCTLTLSAIVTRYDLDYLMRVDGLNGVFSDDLALPVATIVSYTRSGCPLLGPLIDPALPGAITSAQDAMGAAIEPALRTNTVERSVCPLTSP